MIPTSAVSVLQVFNIANDVLSRSHYFSSLYFLTNAVKRDLLSITLLC